MLSSRHYIFWFAAVAIALGLWPASAAPRERILINANWRFIKGDPTNVNSKNLLCRGWFFFRTLFLLVGE